MNKSLDHMNLVRCPDGTDFIEIYIGDRLFDSVEELAAAIGWTRDDVVAYLDIIPVFHETL